MLYYMLEWNGVSHREFIDETIPRTLQRLEARRDQDEEARLLLRVDGSFVNGFASLDDKSTDELLMALSYTPVGELEFQDGLVTQQCQGRDSLTQVRSHFDRLYACLGSITEMKTVNLSLDSQFDPKIEIYQLLSRLSHVRTLGIFDSPDATADYRLREIVSGLRDHSSRSIQKVELGVGSRHFHCILPVFQHLPALEKLVIFGDPDNTALLIEAEHVQPIVNLLAMDIPVNVTIAGFNFLSHAGAHELFYEGILGARVKGLELDQCIFGDPSALASAITNSRLKKINLKAFEFAEWQDDSDMESDADNDASDSEGLSNSHFRAVCVSIFFRELCRGLPYMVQLEDFTCTSYRYTEYDGVPLALTEAAAQCPRLRRFKLGLLQLSAVMDQALADCILVRPTMEELEVRCWDTKLFETRALYKAIQSNFTMKDVRFRTYKCGNYEPWDVDIKKSMDTLLQLNRAGRGSWNKDPTNARVVAGVLEMVIDNVDCVFVLLRGSLFLFGGSCSAPAVACGKRKRDAN